MQLASLLEYETPRRFFATASLSACIRLPGPLHPTPRAPTSTNATQLRQATMQQQRAPSQRSSSDAGVDQRFEFCCAPVLCLGAGLRRPRESSCACRSRLCLTDFDSSRCLRSIAVSLSTIPIELPSAQSTAAGFSASPKDRDVHALQGQIRSQHRMSRARLCGIDWNRLLPHS